MFGRIKQFKNLFPITVTDAVIKTNSNETLTHILDSKEDVKDYYKVTEQPDIREHGRVIRVKSENSEELGEYTIWQLDPQEHARENTLNMSVHSPDNNHAVFTDISLMQYDDAPSLTFNIADYGSRENTYIGEGIRLGSSFLMKRKTKHSGLGIINGNNKIRVLLDGSKSVDDNLSENDYIDFTPEIIKNIPESIKKFVTPTMFGAVGDGITDDTVALQATLDYAADNGSRVFIPKGTYIFSDRLFVRSSMIIYGEGPDKTTLHFVGGRTKATTSHYDETWWEESDSAICIQHSDVSFEDLKLYGVIDNSYNTTFNGMCMHWTKLGVGEDRNSYSSAERVMLQRVTIQGFRNDLFIYAGWCRYIINSSFLDATDSGIKYYGLEPEYVGKWSCSGDVMISCSFNNCGVAGIFASGCYQEELHNCVCEFCGRAFYIEYCQNIILYNCWNEANHDKVKVIGSAVFVGGYNINKETLDSSQGLVTLQTSDETIAIKNGEVVFHQSDGVIIKGVNIGEELENYLKNISFYTHSQAIKVPSLVNWEQYPTWGSEISTDVLYQNEYTYHFNYSGLTNNPEFNINQALTLEIGKYEVGCYVMSPDRSTVDSGFNIGIIYYNADGGVNGWDNYVYTLIGNNSWEKVSTIYNIPSNTAYIKVKFGPKNNGNVYMAQPFVENPDDREVSNLILRYDTNTGSILIKDVNGDIKETIIPGQISEIDSEIESITENYNELKSDIELTTKSLDERVSNLEYASKGILYTEQTDTDSAYTKSVPIRALPYAVLSNLGGKSEKWNQLNMAVSGSAIKNGLTIIRSGVEQSIVGTLIGDRASITFTQEQLIGGHKYLLIHRYNKCRISGTKTSLNCHYSSWTNSANYTISNDTEKDTKKLLFVAKDTREDIYVIDTGTGAEGTVIDIDAEGYVFDLTSMFGAGNEPTSVDDIRIKHIEEVASIKPDYDSGSILNAKTESVISRGKNLWDEEWEVGLFDENGNNAPNNAVLRSKGYIPVKPSTTYIHTIDDNLIFCVYDKDKNCIVANLQWNKNTSIVTTNNTFYIRFRTPSTYGNVYKNDIAIIEGTSGEYEPYKEEILPIPTPIQELDGYGYGVGIADNRVVFEPTVFHNMLCVDLATLNWTLQTASGNPRWYSKLPTISQKNTTDGLDNAELLHPKYMRCSVTQSASNINSIACGKITSTEYGLYCNNGSSTEKPSGILHYEATEGGEDYNASLYRKRVGRVRLKDLNWVMVRGKLPNGVSIVFGYDTSITTSIGDQEIGNILCSKYTTDTNYNVYYELVDKSISVNSSGGLRITDSAYDGPGAFKNHFTDDDYLYYELATEQIYDVTDLLVDFDNTLNVEGGGTVTFEQTDGYTLDVPSTIDYLVKVEV